MLIGVTYVRASMIVLCVDRTENAQEEANLLAGLLPLGGPIPPDQAVAVLTDMTPPFRFPDTLAAVHKQLGLPLRLAPVCAIVDPKTNLVVDTCLADPDHYQPPGKLIFAAPAGIGWVHDPVAQTLTAPLESDPKTLQPLPQAVLSVAPAIVSVDAPL